MAIVCVRLLSAYSKNVAGTTTFKQKMLSGEAVKVKEKLYYGSTDG